MAIAEMRHLSVVGLSKDKKAVLSALQRAGLLQLTDLSAAEDHEGKLYVEGESEPLDTKGEVRRQSLYASEHLRGRLSRAITELGRRFPNAPGLFTEKAEIGSAAFLEVGRRAAEIEHQLAAFEKLLEREITLAAAKETEKQQLAMLTPWQGIELDLRALSTARTESVLGQFPDANRLAEFDAWAKEQPYPVSIQTLANTAAEGEKKPYIAVVYLQENRAGVRGRLQAAAFREIPFRDLAGTPAQLAAATRQRLTEIEKEEASIAGAMTTLAQNEGEFKLLYDFLAVQEEQTGADAELSHTHYTFSLAGWIPAKKAENLQKSLSERFLVATRLRAPLPDEKPPILLQNGWFGRSFQVILEMFGAPDPGETDPTPVMAPFYFLFFGMMLSDVGYGLLLLLGCAYLLFVAKVKGEMNKMGRMLFLSAISSILWGFIFGGFFGNLVTEVTQGKYNFPALWFDPMKDSMKLMIWSMLFGVIHLFAGMAVNVYNLVKDGKAFDALVDVIPWFFVITGLGLLLGGGAGALGPYSAAAGQAGKWMALSGSAVLVLFGGRDSKNPILRILKGILSLYGVTGYFSDILSYTRILALVLATSVIAIVVNKMGFLGGPTPVGYIMFALVGIVGHGLNLLLSALSAYVHASRLQYVEFFGKFLQGGGSYFKPLALNTKYVEVIRDIPL